MRWQRGRASWQGEYGRREAWERHSLLRKQVVGEREEGSAWDGKPSSGASGICQEEVTQRA
ncbi:MAG: hypothetical protein ACSHX7_11640, partial [Luteolibacter sp.]